MSTTRVLINDDVLFNMLSDRVRYWKEGKVAELYDTMYQNYIDSGTFEDTEFDPMQIVDNDVCNWCAIVEQGEKDFDKLLELYHEGEYDVSCEDFEEYKVGFIEAVNQEEDMILIRYY